LEFCQERIFRVCLRVSFSPIPGFLPKEAKEKGLLYYTK
jgi:hypothetical protein